VALPSLVAGLESVADHGILIDSGQPRGLTDATTVLKVLENIKGLVGGKPAAEQRGAFAFRKTVLAGAAGKHSPLVLAIAEANPQIALAT
jgi:hypothetical protein